MPDLLAPMSGDELLAILGPSANPELDAAYDSESCAALALEAAGAALDRMISVGGFRAPTEMIHTLQGLYLTGVETGVRAMFARIAEERGL